MKWWQKIAVVVGAVMLAFGAWSIHQTTMPRHTIYVNAGSCRTPITVIEPDVDTPTGSVIMLHGLAANRRVMNYLGDQLAFDGGLRVYALDLAGHGDNEDPFSFWRAEDCAAATVAKLIETKEIDPKASVYVGHSMGAWIAIRLADREPLAGTVAISPGPTVLPKRMPSNLLVFSGQFDPRPLKRTARDLLKAAGGDRVGVDDFLQQRAFFYDYVRHATHTTQLHNQQVEDDSRDWIINSIEAAAGNADGVMDWRERATWTSEQAPETARGTLGKIWNAAIRNGGLWGAIGLLLIYPLLMAAAGRIAGRHEDVETKAPGAKLAILEWLVFSFAAVLILMVFQPMSFVKLYTGGYVVSLMLVVGMIAAGVNWKLFRENLRWDTKLMVVTAAVALAIFLSYGAWLNWEIDDAWMNAPRWARFLEILPAAWLFFYAEEILLGPVGEGGKRAKRFALFLALRALLFGACAFGVWQLASGQILILLLALPLVALSVLTRLGSDSLRARTGSATAAAFFGAILAAWFAAAVFPLT
jgi:pimeloyl-ACP methyl ester carboxylesterase